MSLKFHEIKNVSNIKKINCFILKNPIFHPKRLEIFYKLEQFYQEKLNFQRKLELAKKFSNFEKIDSHRKSEKVTEYFKKVKSFIKNMKTLRF